jgi:hypothetical protein
MQLGPKEQPVAPGLGTDSRHTPGPWMYRQPESGGRTLPAGEREDWPFHIDKQGTPGRMDWGILIAKCWGHVRASAEANARLIAAAPDQHAEMKRYLPILERAEADPQLWERLTAGLGIATLNGYRAAIAKAEGRP